MSYIESLRKDAAEYNLAQRVNLKEEVLYLRKRVEDLEREIRSLRLNASLLFVNTYKNADCISQTRLPEQSQNLGIDVLPPIRS